ncbi:DUF6542 domain-containing protein [Prauserella muralis]|uniref:Uncharacterized protein n=1 Tax=Prauserella muralis TaxID=588067 RepID=A0A2V4APY7_9PSEU|nr:DUF6542 domain-containing protein [Prauserella muralis]PXY21186.1 hypothetical protein BAY60_27380 [Prauserella muralis]TWE30285.1 hypothetical protein FHX69_2982 [Prauserella muralis]
MTAIRDRQSDPDAADDDAPIPWDERSIVGARRGLPWWGSVLLALGTAVLGAVVDLQVSDALGGLFQGFFLAGSVVAVGAVQRRNLFGPMVQPPLIQAATVPTMVLVASGLPSSSDTLAKVLAISTPLINGFPMMAITTALTVAIGIYRMFRERDPDAPQKVREKGRRADDRDRSDDGARAAGKRKGLGRRAGAADGDVDPDEPTKSVRPAAKRPGKGKPAEARGEPRRGDAAGAAGAAGKRSRPPAEDAKRGRQRRPGPEAAPREGGPREGGPREAGGRTPREQGGRPPRQRPQAPPDAAERRRRAEEWPDSIPGPKRPRRRPASGDEPPPPRRPSGPRRDPGRGERPPRRNRPWDDEQD